MSVAIVHSRAQLGVLAPTVTVEVHLSRGLPGFTLVGLPEKSVKESRDRVRSALINSGFELPAKRITVNLAPADLPKDGGRFDLPIAIGILAASEQFSSESLSTLEFVGELALTGELRSITGVLPAVLAAKQAKRTLVIPAGNELEASLVGVKYFRGANHLLKVCEHLSSTAELPIFQAKKVINKPHYQDLSEVKGQHQAKRALAIAAAGGHNLLFVGPPGSGKTMLASRLPGILPPLSLPEALEAATIASVCAEDVLSAWKQRRFRAPHHSASAAALVGGGNPPRPGEISLAHHGVLFLDELAEFQRSVLEVLREPLESGSITISRAGHQAQFPARFQLVAAMNPCPCGYLTDPGRDCRCSPDIIRRYLAKISGPLLDRIDIQLEVPRLPVDQLHGNKAQSLKENSNEQLREQVLAARDHQLRRCGKANHFLGVNEIDQYCQLDETCRNMLELALTQLKLSARAYHRVLKVSRTIADMEACDAIQASHLAEALQYRLPEQLYAR